MTDNDIARLARIVADLDPDARAQFDEALHALEHPPQDYDSGLTGFIEGLRVVGRGRWKQTRGGGL